MNPVEIYTGTKLMSRDALNLLMPDFSGTLLFSTALESTNM